MNWPEEYRIRFGPMGSERGGPGAFRVPVGDTYVYVVAADESDPPGWEHVSVSNPKFIPRWEHMEAIKRIFWGDDVAVMQLHPARSDWVDCHPNCLHMWRPTTPGVEIPLPPRVLV